ncbi:MAG: type II toxin-antitoxin system HicA family toxin [Microvirga sp.]|jgi:predicted RNA binding protein YcfA (HicA-like mRNA interferase family)
MGRWLTSSRDLIARLKEDGWVLDRIESSHHQFKKRGVPHLVTVPHPKKDLSVGLVKSIYDKAGWPRPGAKS